MKYAKEDLARLHEELYRTLAEVIRVCEVCGIPYFIQGGSAIGARNNHYIEEEVTDTGKKEVVCILVMHKIMLFEPVDGELDKGCGKNAYDEVEAVDDGSCALKEDTDRIHKYVSNEIRKSHKSYLDRKLVNAFLHRDIVRRLNLVHIDLFKLVGLLNKLTFAFKYIKMNNTAKGCEKESARCDC